MESHLPNRKRSSSPIKLRQQKALTFQHPNERELKNVARWIYGWNLWTELVRQILELFHPESGVDLFSTPQNQVKFDNDTKESVLTELQTYIVTKQIQTLSKVKTIRRIKEIGLKIDVWEKVQTEGVRYLSCVQIGLCEYKIGERKMAKEHYQILELLKAKFLEKIVTACMNIDVYYKQMENAISIFKNHRCNAIFINPVVAKAIERCNKRIFQPIIIPGIIFDNKEQDFKLTSNAATPILGPVQQVSTSLSSRSISNSNKKCKSKTKSKSRASSSSYVPDVPDFIESLFAGRKSLKAGSISTECKNSLDISLSFSTTLTVVKHFIEIIQQGTEWYFAWTQFTEKVLQEIKSLAPSLGPEVMSYMTKHIQQQINLLKGLSFGVRSLGKKTKQLIRSDSSVCGNPTTSANEEMSVVITCLSVLDDFVSLIESIKHEASYLIRYVEIALINLGVLDLNKEPARIQPLRLYLMRNIISMKDCHLLTSIDFLYLEMGSLLEYTENRFHSDDNFLEKFGQITADLLKKYTVNRKEVIQEREFVNIQNFDTMELEKELISCPTQRSGCVDPATNLNSNSSNPKSPMSRYQRAEDLRKWVEESKRTLQELSLSKTTGDFMDAEDCNCSSGKHISNHIMDSVNDSPSPATYCENSWLHSSGKVTLLGENKVDASLQDHTVHFL